MIKLVVVNNMLFHHVIKTSEPVKDMYLSHTQLYNLIINQGAGIVIKKAIEEDNEQKYKARNEVVAKIYTKNKKTYIKIGIGKNYKPISSIEDINDEWEVPIENYTDIEKFVVQDFEKYEEYEEAKKLLKTTKNRSVKKIEDF